MFAQAGANLILTARRIDRLEAFAEELREEFGISVHPVQLDVRDRHRVESVFESVPPEWTEIEILINNAGLSRGMEKLHEGSIEDWEEMIDANLKGLLYVSRAIVPGLVSRGKGHIVNIGSIAGRQRLSGGERVLCVKSRSTGDFAGVEARFARDSHPGERNRAGFGGDGV